MSAPATIGSLTDRVALAVKVTVPEDGGGHAVTYMPLGAAWARVRALGLSQRVEADGRTVAASHSVVLRFRSDIGAGDRITWRDRVLDVLGTEDLDGRRTWLGCRCVEMGVVG